jgi:flagellar basal-body rod modification protein FlgD
MILGGATETNVLLADGHAATSQAKLEEDLNQFLNLLVTQLKNQDPLDPMDATEFTSQLVQFASVEQQIKTNGHMEKLLNLSETSQVSTMVNFIGTAVEATGNKLALQGKNTAFTYSINQNASEVQISIQNEKGITVFFGEGETTTGTHGFTWDGKSANGTQHQDGVYTLIVTAKDASGDLMNVDQTIFGNVTGAGVEDGQVSLFLDDVIIPMENVLSVSEVKPAPVVN